MKCVLWITTCDSQGYNYIKKKNIEVEEEDISESETEKEYLNDFFGKIDLFDTPPDQVNIGLHTGTVYTMSPVKITKVHHFFKSGEYIFYIFSAYTQGF